MIHELRRELKSHVEIVVQQRNVRIADSEESSSLARQGKALLKELPGRCCSSLAILL